MEKLHSIYRKILILEIKDCSNLIEESKREIAKIDATNPFYGMMSGCIELLTDKMENYERELLKPQEPEHVINRFIENVKKRELSKNNPDYAFLY